MLNYIYLDYNACGIILPTVQQEIFKLIQHPFNPSSTHFLGQKASHYLEKTIDTFLKYFGCGNEYKIIFTSSGSESNNLAIKSLKYNKNENFDIFICSAAEHKSVLLPIQQQKKSFHSPCYK